MGPQPGGLAIPVYVHGAQPAPRAAPRRPAAHLMTTRLPFTSTLSRVSLLERDMMIAAAVRSLPPPPSLCRAIRPRRRYAGRLVRARCRLDSRGPRRAPIGRAVRPSAIRPPPREAALRRRPGHVSHGAAAA